MAIIVITLTMLACGLLLVGCSDGKDGNNGKDGSQWNIGTSAPSADSGSDGDFYLDTTTYDLYYKNNGVWEKIGSIKGEDGADGKDGEDGKDGADGASFYTGYGSPIDNERSGNPGDAYLDEATYDLYKYDGETWVLIGNIKGEQGEIITGDLVTVTKLGNASNPVILTEGNITDLSISYDEQSKMSIYSTNRLNIANAGFTMNSYSSYNTIIKENDGLTIQSTDLPAVWSSGYASYEYTAEFTGTLWLSAEASCSGDVTDVGMRMNVNGVAAQLCRGEGLLQESVEVNEGDTVKIIFYSHIGTQAANTIYYKNIMLSYGNEPFDYTPYFESISNYSGQKSIILDGSEGMDYYTTATTKAGGTDYYFYFNLDETALAEMADDVLPTSNSSIANIVVSCDSFELGAVSYNNAYANSIGVGISTLGKVAIYIGSGYTRTTFVEWLAEHPITISYNTSEQVYVGFGEDVLSNITSGCVIASDCDFSVSYTYINQKKTTSIVCLGDSITGMFTNQTDYPSMITRSSSIQAYNAGFSGSCYTDYPGGGKYLPFSLNRIVDSICSGDFSSQDSTVDQCKDVYKERLATLKSIDFSTIDYVVILMGTNDWGYNVTLKSEDDESTEEKYRTNVEDAVCYCISELKKSFPNLKIIVYSPMYRVLSGEDSAVTPNENGDYLRDYSAFIYEMAKLSGADYVLNLYESFEISYSNFRRYLSDGTHPNEKGKNLLANLTINIIKDILKDA